MYRAAVTGSGYRVRLPGEGAGAEDGGVRVVEGGEDDLDLVFPEGEDIGLESLYCGLEDEVAGFAESAEENDGLGGAEGYEVSQ